MHRTQFGLIGAARLPRGALRYRDDWEPAPFCAL